jgi:hypothetical protein
VRPPGTARTQARAILRPAAAVLAAAGLFTLYSRQSQSVPLSSDGASNVPGTRSGQPRRNLSDTVYQVRLPL